MKLLVLGGTLFLGRHLVAAARDRGHEITLFNRGRTAPELYPELEHLVGDRASDLSALRDRQFDALADTSGFLPSAVRASAGMLADSVESYAFVSSISAYARYSAGMDETSPLAQLPAGALEELTDDTYGPLKAVCEREVERTFPGRALIVRPCVIAGPHDPTDRFTYWVRRAANGETALAPGEPDRPVQLIDARDLAEWLIRSLEEDVTGAFNAAGPEGWLTFGGMVEACAEAAGSSPHFVWVPDQFLLDRRVQPLEDLPLWLPLEDAERFFEVDSGEAISRGLHFRPLVETAREGELLRAYAGSAGLPSRPGAAPGVFLRARELAGLPP